MELKHRYSHLYNLLSTFSVGRLDINIRATEDIHFNPARPIGYIWRDSLAFTLKILKKKLCFYKWQIPQEDCMTCDKTGCSLYIYRYFSPGFDKPKPFTLYHSDNSVSYKKGSSFILSLYLIADALDEATMFVKAITALGSNKTWQNAQGSFTVEGVTEGDYIEFGNVECNEPLSEILLEVITPMKLASEKEGIQYKGFKPDLFMRLLINRVINLNYIYNSKAPVTDDKSKHEKELLIKLSEELTSKGYTAWQEKNRVTRTQGRIKVGGLDGIIMLKGQLEAFYPFLKIGEYIGVGSNTTSGYGRYKLYRVFTA